MLETRSIMSSINLDILKIDNLWIYENITKLQLDNNIIEKIENIHFLVNLEWLGELLWSLLIIAIETFS